MQKQRKTPLNLGYIEYPNVEIDSQSHMAREVVIKLTNCKRIVKVKMGLSCVQTLARLTREILAKYRDNIKSDWAEFKALNRHTGANIDE